MTPTGTHLGEAVGYRDWNKESKGFVACVCSPEAPEPEWGKRRGRESAALPWRKDGGEEMGSELQSHRGEECAAVEETAANGPSLQLSL